LIDWLSWTFSEVKVKAKWVNQKGNVPLYLVIEEKPNSSHKEQALGDRGEEKLPFNRKKLPTELSASTVWV